MKEQLAFGFDVFERQGRIGRLPAKMEEAAPYYRKLIEKHHLAMMAGNESEVMQNRREALELARNLNSGSAGILADEDAPGSVLERLTAAQPGAVPLWGATGDFILDVNRMRVRIEQEGMLGIGSTMLFWLGFAARAVDYDKPFLSETGYRSFMGINAPPVPNRTVDMAARETILAYLQQECKGKLKNIESRYVERHRAAAEP